MSMERNLFDELGGEVKLRPIIDRFVDRIMDDIMIGFFFRGVDRQRLKDLEFQHAARMLGAKLPYEGRPLRDAHALHRIMGGQFARRKEILRQTLEEMGAPEAVQQRLLEQTEKLRALITRDAGSECTSQDG